MRPVSSTYTITAASTTGVCASQTPLAAGALTINGGSAVSGVVTLPTAQHISVSCVGSDAARTFTITGTDYAGQMLTENIAGSSGSITNGTKNFKTVTSVTVDAATAGAITVGILATFELPWICLDTYQQNFNYAWQVVIGAATFQVEGTLDNVEDSTVTPVVTTVQASGTSSITGNSTSPSRAVRVKVTAYTSGTVTFRVLQAGK